MHCSAPVGWLCSQYRYARNFAHSKFEMRFDLEFLDCGRIQMDFCICPLWRCHWLFNPHLNIFKELMRCANLCIFGILSNFKLNVNFPICPPLTIKAPISEQPIWYCVENLPRYGQLKFHYLCTFTSVSNAVSQSQFWHCVYMAPVWVHFHPHPPSTLSLFRYKHACNNKCTHTFPL